jgi:hypothetical protein
MGFRGELLVQIGNSLSQREDDLPCAYQLCFFELERDLASL